MPRGGRRLRHTWMGALLAGGELAQLAGLRNSWRLGRRRGFRRSIFSGCKATYCGGAQGNVLRLARVLSAVAACILVAGSIQLIRSKVATVPVAAPNPPWVEATLPGGDLRGTGTPAAQWYLADATHGSEEIP